MTKEIENRICQNCKNDFTIEPDDFSFYEKMKVPPPTFCPECRRIRRFSWRNERSLYKRNCDMCQKSIISIHENTAPFPVYCHPCWLSDNWDATSHGTDFDFSKPFFAQFQELLNKVPRLALFQRNSINSDYSSSAVESKNVYLSFSVTSESDTVYYSRTIDHSSNIFDSYNLKNCESSYEDVYGESNYNSRYMLLSRNCIDSYFLIDCVNCTDCFMSANIRNKKYCIRGEQNNREDYFKEISKYNLGSRKVRDQLNEEFKNLTQSAIYRYANVLQSYNSTGNNLLNNKNCKNCFDLYDSEDCKNCYRAFKLKECRDFDFGAEAELVYEYITYAKNIFNIRFSLNSVNEIRDSDYADLCMNSQDLFGCIAIKNKQYVILNKVYSREEYLELKDKIIKHMTDMPFVSGDITYGYGEFFPTEISPFAFNETIAYDLSPLTKEETLSKNYRYREKDLKEYKISIKSGSIPDDIKETENSLTQEVFECSHLSQCNHQCTSAFRVTENEMQFYKKNNIPLPNKCPNCRYYERIALFFEPPKLYSGKCMCDKSGHGHENKCPNEFMTPYAPGRPEKVYCESCYNKEIY